MMADLDDLACQISEVLSVEGWSLAVAESCTGGLLAYSFVRRAGASSFFLGGITSYANAAKIKLLAVRDETIATFGAVSVECAQEMLVGVQTLFSSDVAVAVTGIAGPDGGTETKPVGTVYVAVSVQGTSSVVKHQFSGARESIQRQAVCAALRQISEIICATTCEQLFDSV